MGSMLLEASVSANPSANPSASPDDVFDEFVRGRAAHLLRLALLLGGQDRGEAEDLLQIALERAWARRASLVRDRSPEPYVRRVLVNAAIDRHRRMRRRSEFLGLAGREPAQSDHSASLADRDLLMRGLASLPSRQRAVLVLRFWEDQDVAAIASLLGCSVGTVKSQLLRGLARLRQVAELADPEPDRRTAGSA